MKCSHDLLFVSFFAVRRKERKYASFSPHPQPLGGNMAVLFYPALKGGAIKIIPLWGFQIIMAFAFRHHLIRFFRRSNLR